jgi:hypothetical protein
MPGQRTADPSTTDIERAVRERAMRQLSMCARLRAVVLLALGARLVID